MVVFAVVFGQCEAEPSEQFEQSIAFAGLAVDRLVVDRKFVDDEPVVGIESLVVDRPLALDESAFALDELGLVVDERALVRDRMPVDGLAFRGRPARLGREPATEHVRSAEVLAEVLVDWRLDDLTSKLDRLTWEQTPDGELEVLV